MALRSKTILAVLILSASLCGHAQSDSFPKVSPKQILRSTQVAQVPPLAVSALASAAKLQGQLYVRIPVQGRPRFLIGNLKVGFLSTRKKDLALSPKASREAKRCWDILLSGGLECVSTATAVKAFQNERDPLEFARALKERYGMRIARDGLWQRMGEMDANGSQLETRVLQTTKDDNLVFANSLAKLTLRERQRTGVFVIYGLEVTGKTSPNRPLIRNAAEMAKKLGFYTRILDTHPYAPFETNARSIAEQILEHSKKVDRFLIAAASKGVADALTALVVKQSEFLKDLDRSKFRLMLCLSGVVRESHFARWITQHNQPMALITRTKLKWDAPGIIDGLLDLARGPWGSSELARPKDLARLYPHLKWISYSMLPGADDGHFRDETIQTRINESVIVTSDRISPHDGLVESAGTILPPDEDGKSIHSSVEQHIIRGFGTHTLALGRLRDGTPLSPKIQKAMPPLNPEAGSEILSALFRAIPKSLIGLD